MQRFGIARFAAENSVRQTKNGDRISDFKTLNSAIRIRSFALKK